MAITVTIPFSVLNRIPGVSGIEDVTFDVPEEDEIIDSILDGVPSPDDIETAVNEGLIEAIEDATFIDELADILVDPLVEAVERETGLDFPGPEELADEIVDRLDLSEIGPVTIDLEGSLFDVEQDLIEFAADVLREAGLDEILEVDPFTGLLDPLTDAESDFSSFVNDPIGFLEEQIVTPIEDVIEDLMPDWLPDSLEQLAEDLGGLIEEKLISQEVVDNLEDTLEGRD